jgi:hypothetical protein
MQLKKNPTLLQMAQAPLTMAEALLKSDSDTESARHARYLIHWDLQQLLAMAAGYRKAERPLKLFMDMLEIKGMKQPPASVIKEVYGPTVAEILDQQVTETIDGMPLQPPTEEARMLGLA